MIRNLTPIGEQLGLIIDQQLLDLLNINRETPLELTVDGCGLHIRPVDQGHRARVLEAAEEMMDIHEETLRRLAQ